MGGGSGWWWEGIRQAKAIENVENGENVVSSRHGFVFLYSKFPYMIPFTGFALFFLHEEAAVSRPNSGY